MRPKLQNPSPIEARLSDCPWCHNTPKLERDFCGSWIVACRNGSCPTRPITLGFDNPEQALLTWNCREHADIKPKPKSGS